VRARARNTARAAPRAPQYAWLGNNYAWDVTLLASMSSLAGLLLFSAAATALREGLGVAGVGISDLLAVVPGFALLAGNAADAADAADASPAPSSDGSSAPPDGKAAAHDADAALVPTGVPLAPAGAELVSLGPPADAPPPPPIVAPAPAPLYPLPVQLGDVPAADPATAVLWGAA
jgi:hypothetical protein